MDIWESKVSCYNKTQRGKTSLQCEIRLNKGHPFTKGDKVVVAGLDDFNKKEEEIRELKEEVERLSLANTKLTLDSSDILRKLVVASEIRTKYKDVNGVQERLLTIYRKRGLWDRIKNETPEGEGELVESKDNLKKLEDSTPLVIELNPAGEGGNHERIKNNPRRS